MFFRPQTREKEEKKVCLSAAATLSGFTGYAKEVAKGWIAGYGAGDAPFAVTAAPDATLPAEEYDIVLAADRIDVRYADERGGIYAALTLRQLSACGELFAGHLADAPDCAFRGYRVFLPGRRI